MAKETKYARKGQSIKDLKTGEVTKFRSINQAKRGSRELQLIEDGALGRGSLMVVEKRFPATLSKT